jgi:hypothetical protein
MFKFIALLFKERKDRKAKKRELKALREQQREEAIKQMMKDGSLWKDQCYPKGHPAHIASID